MFNTAGFKTPHYREPIDTNGARPHYRKQREGDLDKKLQAGEEKRKLSENFENGLVIYIPRH